jgi:hypothetical protein
MKLFENIFRKSNKELRLKISKENFNDYILISIDGENIPYGVLTSLYLKVMESVFSECPYIAVSQFIDETQGMIKDKHALFERLSEVYKVEVAPTRKYDLLIQPSEEDKEYIINIFGKIDTNWLDDTLRYGGTCLSNIIYGFHEFIPDWLVKLIERNKLFIQWYQLEVDYSEITTLADEVGTFCFTSDSCLQCFIKNDEEEKVLNEINGYIF